MRLLILSHTAHYFEDDRHIGYGPTIKEINWLAHAFDEVIHLAFCHPGPAPRNALHYDAENIKIITVPPSGGLSMGDKLRVISHSILYIKQIIRLVPSADVIHVRCPGSLGLYGMIVSSFVRKKKKWIKFAGNWKGIFNQTAPSHFFQREWLRLGLSHAIVTVNGIWPNQPDFVMSFLNPSASINEIITAREKCEGKKLNPPYRIVFVGHTSPSKGSQIALNIVKQLNSDYPGQLIFDIVGDGPERFSLEEFVNNNKLQDCVQFHGWVPHPQVFDILTPAHFILLPTTSEGWPKILSEAMMFGAVPLASAISSIPQLFSSIGAGIPVSPNDVNIYTEKIQYLINNPDEWERMSKAGMNSAPQFSYERYLIAVDNMFRKFYGQSPLNQGFLAEAREDFTNVSKLNLNKFWSDL